MKTQNPLIGRASGKFGEAIFSTLDGKNIVRSKAVSYRDANSETQKATRRRFSLAGQFAKQAAPFLEHVYPRSVAKMNPVSYAIKGIMAATTDNGTAASINFSNIFGNLNPTLGTIITQVVTATDSVEVELDNLTSYDFSMISDKILILVINEDTRAVNLFEHTVDGENTTAVVDLVGTLSGHVVKAYAINKSLKAVSKFKSGSELQASL
jgi:hypothetical protein